MADTNETNHLLREIRDILAAQESKYEQHIKRTQEMYAEQIQTNAEERKKSLRMLFAWGMILVGLLCVLWKLLSQ
jgi:hypothetical protein